MKKRFKVTSQEGADFARTEEGAEVELDLEKEQETAVVAAGWLEEAKPKKGAGS